MDNRVERILQDYVIDLHAEFVAEYAEQGFALFSERLLSSLSNIHRRLGGERYQRLMTLMEEALAQMARTGQVELFRHWTELLLSEYYDPMYAFQREKKEARIEFVGEQAAVLEYLRERANR